jgi:hypothetical protein
VASQTSSGAAAVPREHTHPTVSRRHILGSDRASPSIPRSPRVGSARRADPRFRRASAVSPPPFAPPRLRGKSRSISPPER